MWTSVTGKFGLQDMQMLEEAGAEALLDPLRISTPLTVLRALTEIKRNGAADKLAVLMADPDINAKWRRFASVRGADNRDYQYAVELNEL